MVSVINDEHVATPEDINRARAASDSSETYKPISTQIYERKHFCKGLDAYGDTKDYALKVKENPTDSRALMDYGRHIYGDEKAMYRMYKGDTTAIAKDATAVVENSMRAVSDYVNYGNNLEELLGIIGYSDKNIELGKRELPKILLGMRHIRSRPLDRKDPQGKHGREDPYHDTRVALVERIQYLSQVANEKDAQKRLEGMRQEIFNEINSGRLNVSDHEKEVLAFFSDRREIIEQHFNRIYGRELGAFYQTFNYRTCVEVVKTNNDLIRKDLELDGITKDRIADNMRDLLAPQNEMIATAAFQRDDKLNKADKMRGDRETRIKEEGKAIRKGQGIPR